LSFLRQRLSFLRQRLSFLRQRAGSEHAGPRHIQLSQGSTD
jgi:hypothetical protein